MQRGRGDAVGSTTVDIEAIRARVRELVAEEDWEHVCAVARFAERPREEAVALLHDVYEDGLMTGEELRLLAPVPVAEAVLLLARRGDEPYVAYLGHLVASKNVLALTVKVYDLMDHLLPRRVAHFRARPEKRERYLRALEAIHAALVALIPAGATVYARLPADSVGFLG